MPLYIKEGIHVMKKLMIGKIKAVIKKIIMK